jgi:hypothetical protein
VRRPPILGERSQERQVKNNESTTAEPPDLEGLPEDVQQAMARARRATEELPPLEELAALQEAMLGLAEMSALVGRLRKGPGGEEESVEEPAEKPGSTRGSACPEKRSEAGDGKDD